MMKLKKIATLTTVLTLGGVGFSSASSLVGLFDNGGGSYSLGSFDSASPTSVAFSTVTGLVGGETLLGLDFRPATGQIYAIGSSTNVYTFSGGTATSIGTFSSAVPGSSFGYDYNPVLAGGEFARVISDTNDNRVISGNTGAYLGADKVDVFYPTGDINAGVDPEINHIAYTDSVLGATATQQYGIDTSLDILTTVANNAGTLETVGSLGIDAGVFGGFDIDGLTGEAFLGYQTTPGLSELYSVDLDTGAATSAGLVQGSLIGLTAVPEPSSALLVGLAGLGFIARRRR